MSLRFPFSLPKSGLLGISHGVSFEVDARHAEKYAGRGACIAAMPEDAAAPRTDPLMDRRPGVVDRAATEVICSAGVKSATRPRNNFPERANGSRTRMHRLTRTGCFPHAAYPQKNPEPEHNASDSGLESSHTWTSPDDYDASGAMNPSSTSWSMTACTLSSTFSASVSMTSSGSAGGSYGAEMPVKFLISPDSAFS